MSTLKRNKKLALPSSSISENPSPGRVRSGTVFLVAWIFGIGILFLKGGHLDGRVPQPILFENFINLLLSVNYPIVEGLLRNALVAGLIWFLFSRLGDTLLKALRLDRSATTAAEWLLLSLGLGAGAVSLALLLLGLAGYWAPTFLRGAFGACVLVGLGAIVWARSRKSAASESPHLVLAAKGHLGIYANTALIIILGAVALNLLATAAPEVFYDSLVYHLALPKLYLLNGRIFPTPQNLYSGLPFGMEMLYGLSLALSSEHLAVLLHCSFGWAAAFALANWLRRYSSREFAVFGALNFILCPVVLAEGWQCGIDLGTAFYFAVALIALTCALNSPDEIQARRWSLVSGILIGFALSTKYTALPLGVAFVFVHGWLRVRDRKSLRDTLWMGVAAAAIAAPWLFKNFSFYGDPVYPFLHQRLGFVAPAHWDKFLSDAHAPDLASIFGTLSGWKDFVILPWRLATDRYFDYRVSLVYLLLLPTLFTEHWGVFKKEPVVPPSWTGVVTLIIGGYLLWSTTSTITRFLIPVLLLVSAFSALATDRLEGSWLRSFIWLLAIAVAICNFSAIYIDGFPAPGLSGKWSVLRGRQSEADYLKADHVGYGQPYYAAMDFINQKLPPNSKVIFLGESRGYYCERNFVAATVFDHNPFWVAAKDAKSAADLHDKLKAMGITHIFVNVFQLYSNASFTAMLPRDVAASPIFAEFWAHYLRKDFEDKEVAPSGQIQTWLTVYELVDSSARNLKNSPGNPILDTLRILQAQGR